MQARQLKLPIPVTILTGSLGVGKTTALCRLVAQKPADEVWCCIVNEFGAVGIDAVAIESSSAVSGNVVVKQLAGGCMCCVLSGPLSAAIAQVIRQVKPDRVIIEPSGLGHPGGLIDILQGPHLCTALQLNAVLCLVDLTTFQSATLMSNSIAADQITVADVLIGSKADAAAPATVQAFEIWAGSELFPPKHKVLTIAHGQLDSKWLDAPRAAGTGQLLFKANKRSSRTLAVTQQQPLTIQQPSAQQPDAVDSKAPDSSPGTGGTAIDRAVDGDDSSRVPQRGQPELVAGAGDDPSGQYASCGWVFHQDDMFDQLLLMQLLHELQPLVARVKGVFRVGPKQWVAPSSLSLHQQRQGVAGQHGMQQMQQEARPAMQLSPICYRGVSMIEVIIHSSRSALQQLVERLQTVAGGLQHSRNASSGSSMMMSVTASHELSGVDAVWEVLQYALLGCLQAHD